MTNLQQAGLKIAAFLKFLVEYPGNYHAFDFKGMRICLNSCCGDHDRGKGYRADALKHAQQLEIPSWMPDGSYEILRERSSDADERYQVTCNGTVALLKLAAQALLDNLELTHIQVRHVFDAQHPAHILIEAQYFLSKVPLQEEVDGILAMAEEIKKISPVDVRVKIGIEQITYPHIPK